MQRFLVSRLPQRGHPGVEVPRHLLLQGRAIPAQLLQHLPIAEGPARQQQIKLVQSSFITHNRLRLSLHSGSLVRSTFVRELSGPLDSTRVLMRYGNGFRLGRFVKHGPAASAWGGGGDVRQKQNYRLKTIK
jgi:hypothetical protein